MTVGEHNYKGFEQRYADTIAGHPVREHYERPAMLSLLPDVAGWSVLDAGCGPGQYSAWLLNQGARVTAFDLMPAFVEMTRQQTRGEAHVLQADLGQPLTFAADESFDLVLSSLVVHYIQDWGAMFRELWRVLKPNGLLIFSTMHPLGKPDDVAYMETRLYDSVWKNFEEPYPVIRLYHRPLSAIFNPISAAGFSIIGVHEPTATDALAAASPQDYAVFSKVPGFLMVTAVK